MKLPALLPACALLLASTALISCDKNGHVGVLQRPPDNTALVGEVVPDKSYEEAFAAKTSILGDTAYLIITKAQRGSVFTLHTGPRPVASHAICFASTNTAGFRECVEQYYQKSGAVAILNDEAGWWATPL